MADFMTVLAASQKQAPTAAHGKALAGLLPEGLFENVLSAQMGAAETPALLPPLLLSEQVTLADQPPARKPPPQQIVEAEKAADVALLPIAVANVAVKAASATSATDADEPAAELAPRVLRTMQSKMAPEMAATSAASGVGQRQELPLTPAQQVLALGGAQASTQAAALLEGGGEVLPPLTAVTTPVEAGRPLDPSVLAATRQLGPLEQFARTAEAPIRATLDAPLRSQGFPAEFSEKIVWLVGRQAQSADLSLNPPQLGALEVRLSLSGSEAGAQFYSPNPLVREAIESALPRLRELMAQAGIMLGDAQVRDEAFSRDEAGGSARAGAKLTADEANAALAPLAGGVVRAGLGLIDLYA
ncbi:MAG: flagellar hook-length control protein FliK [Pseudomonadota bacterium]|nr:flagellar hook-length control protein FliK [Pseudomonadota bacterium]MDP1905571.1 flagellar hook-length control protein FliK [Pseudomonadota bacterium]MDP2352460.1 flagellar hook-length control protein FliK [Pseudomonadota bacterium]